MLQAPRHAAGFVVKSRDEIPRPRRRILTSPCAGVHRLCRQRWRRSLRGHPFGWAFRRAFSKEGDARHLRDTPSRPSAVSVWLLQEPALANSVPDLAPARTSTPLAPSFPASA